MDNENEFDLAREQGQEVGRLARNAFPGGVLIASDHEHSEAMAQTAEYLKHGRAHTIFEPAFSAEGILVRPDVLKKLSGDRWHLLEVKASSDVKPHHIADVAIQKWVIERWGLKLAKVSIMHLSPSYVYDGRHLDLQRLFTVADVTDEVAEFSRRIPRLLCEMKRMLACTHPPRVAAGEQCSIPYECEFYDRCNE